MIYIISDFQIDSNSNSYCDHFPKSSIDNIILKLQKSGYDCQFFGGVAELINANNSKMTFDKNTIFLNMSDGLFQTGRRMQVPILLDLLQVKYSGSRPFSVGLMSNKFFSKEAAKDCDVLIPNGLLINKNNLKNSLKTIKNNFSYPLIIKPNNEGSSIGITNESIINNFEELVKQSNLGIQKFDELLVEEYIIGTDASTLIIGNVNNIKLNETLIYKTFDKFILNKSVRDTSVKANWSSENYLIDSLDDYRHLKNEFSVISEKIFNYICCNDIARIDYRITPNGDIYFLEINSMPTITPTSDVGVIYNLLNKKYEDFLKDYIDTIHSRYNI